MVSLLLLRLLETVDKKGVGFIDLSFEVLVVSHQLSEVDSVLIQKHSCNSWCTLFAISLLDSSKDSISHEVVSVLLFLWPLHVIEY